MNNRGWGGKPRNLKTPTKMTQQQQKCQHTYTHTDTNQVIKVEYYDATETTMMIHGHHEYT